MKQLLLTLVLTFCCLATQAAKVQEVPYSQAFGNANTMNDFIIIDANDDDNTWFYNPMMNIATCMGSYDGDSDDYLLLPLHLQPYTQYEVTFSCYASKFCTSRYDTWLADAPNVEGMKTQLSAPKEVKYEDDNNVQRISFAVTAEGTYYFALHNCSAEYEGSLFLNYINVTSTAAATPSAPTIVSAIPGERGAHTCDLAFTLPTTNLEGKTLSAISKVNIYRNDVLAATLLKDAEGNDVAPGASCTWRDEALSNRLYTYKIMALDNAGSEGAPAVAEVYVGIDRPGRVSNLELREDVNRLGHVIMTWEAPTVGVHGGYIDPKGLSYVVSLPDNSELTVYEPRFETNLSIGSEQTYAAFSIFAQNTAGSNRSNWQTISTHIGPAKTAPWAESFADVSCKGGPWLTHVTGNTEIGDASWYVSSPDGGIPAQDGDGGYTHFFTKTQGCSSRYTSPKIDIRELASPTLTFWLYDKGLGDVVEVGVMPEMTEWSTLESITLNTGKGWQRFEVDLAAFRHASFIQVGFNGICWGNEPQNITAIDNISIRNAAKHDLVVESFDFPARVNVGEPSDFAITLRNRGNGALAAGSYTVNLYRQDDAEAERTPVCSTEGKAVASDKTTTLLLSDTPGVFTPKSVLYSAEVVLDDDATPADNLVAPQPTTVFMPPYPAPDELAAESSTEGISMSWRAPEVGEGSALPVTDDFEAYPLFSIDDCGDWKLYDADGQYTLTMAITIGSEVQLLEYEHAGEPMAWQVFSPYDAGIPYGSWEPHSGELMMVAMGNAKNQADGTYHDNDDWLISPQLSGRAQQISFFAKCGMSSAYQPERLEVLYSTTDNAPGSFVALGDVIELYNVNAWEEHIVELPAGARFFALRCVSEHKFALLLDDVTYQPAGSADLTLRGFNVYRDRRLLNTSPVPTPIFTDTTAADGNTYEYCVTALYDKGESLPSAPVSISYTQNAISAPHTPQAATERYDLQGRRIGGSAQVPVCINHNSQKSKTTINRY